MVSNADLASLALIISVTMRRLRARVTSVIYIYGPDPQQKKKDPELRALV